MIAVTLLITPMTRLENSPDTVPATFAGWVARCASAPEPRNAWKLAGSSSSRAIIFDCSTIDELGRQPHADGSLEPDQQGLEQRGERHGRQQRRGVDLGATGEPVDEQPGQPRYQDLGNDQQQAEYADQCDPVARSDQVLPQSAHHPRRPATAVELRTRAHEQCDAGEGLVELGGAAGAPTDGRIVQVPGVTTPALDHEEVLEPPEHDGGHLLFPEVIRLAASRRHGAARSRSRRP